MKILMSSLALLAFSLPITSCAAKTQVPQLRVMQETTIKFEIIFPILGKGQCSGTAVSKKAFITAKHCFDEPVPGIKPTHIEVGGQKIGVAELIHDNKDHTLVVLADGFHFDKWANVQVRDMHQGESVCWIGNPSAFTNLLRCGLVSGYNGRDTLIDAQNFPGDSGSGIFDEDGLVVGVVSYYVFASDKRSGATFQMSAAIDFEFTPDDWKRAGVKVK